MCTRTFGIVSLTTVTPVSSTWKKNYFDEYNIIRMTYMYSKLMKTLVRELDGPWGHSDPG